MYLLGARWYDPSIARFVSVDPHPGDQDDALSQNEYVYCGNNPINNTDPDGDKWGKVAAGLAIGVGVALCFTGVGGFAGAVLIGAASGALIDGGSAYLNGARGKSLAKATGKGALIGGLTAGIGYGAEKAIAKGLSAAATKGLRYNNPVTKKTVIAIERHGFYPKKGMGVNGAIKNIGHINIGESGHIMKPSTAKKIGKAAVWVAKKRR